MTRTGQAKREQRADELAKNNLVGWTSESAFFVDGLGGPSYNVNGLGGPSYNSGTYFPPNPET